MRRDTLVDSIMRRIAMASYSGLDQSILEKATELLSQSRLCDNCFGRQFALLCTGSSNYQRGSAIKLVLALHAHHLMKSGAIEKGQKLLFCNRYSA